MDWPQRMSAAVEYIENNLDGEIDVKKAADIACYSPFYFQRMFLVITGVPLSEYIRRRRLTLAAADISSGESRIIDIALKYGYDSPDAFTRAFRSMHGVSPKMVRSAKTRLVAFPRISFQIIMKGGTDMDYRIIDKPGFNFAGRIKEFTTVNEENFVKIPEWWDGFLKSPDCNQLAALTGNKPGTITKGGMLGICIGTGIEFSYGIGIELLPGKQPGNFRLIHVPEARWAIFECTLESLQEVTKRIFTEWFPSTGYEHDDIPEIEVYLSQKPGKQMPCEIWIPVKKK